MKRKAQVTYTGLHFFYWMVDAAIAAFASAFLLPQGYSTGMIGLLMSLSGIGAVLIDPVLADYADHSRFSVAEILMACTGVLFLTGWMLVELHGKSLGLSVFYILAYVLHSVIRPLLNALNYHLERAGHPMNFGSARAMGSFGYSLISVFLGFLAERYGIAVIPVSMMMEAAIIIVLLVIANRLLNGTKRMAEEKPREQGGIVAFVKKYPMLVLLAFGCGLLMTGTIGSSTFMLQILMTVQAGTKELGVALALAGFVEIPVMLFYKKLEDRFGSRKLLRFSGIGYIVKQGILLLAGNYLMILFSQLFQMVSFALYLPSGVSYMNEHTDSHESVKAQALLTMFMSASVLLASLGGGLLIDVFGVKWFLISCLGVAVLGAVIVFVSTSESAEKQ